ncbi:MAG: DUF4838 domain-containing protein [Armatimonadota bacterium]
MLAIDAVPVVLAQGGLRGVKVVVPAGASGAEEYAAEELRRHLFAIIGAGPQLRTPAYRPGQVRGAAVYVNDREAAAAAGIDVAALTLAPEAFHLETRNGSLYLLGGGPRGVLYGVYEVLERLGCRWYTPEISHLPRRSQLVLPAMRYTAAPAFEFRDMWNWEGHDPAWWVRNRLNGWYTPVPDYMGGHMTYELFVHSFDRLMPPDEFFDRHPEYYSEINGVRRREASQLCLSNPDVLRIITERVLERMRANPKATIVSVSQNDCAGYCECPRCRAIAEEESAQSGPLLRFVNAVAEETCKVFPDKLIDTLAYWYSLDAPRQVTPHPNVRVRLCSISCCQGHEYGTCDHPESARFLRALQGWSRMTEQMYIWHYCTDFAHYPLPMPNFDELHANINLYQKFGVYGIFMQGMGEEGGGGESMALRGYVLSKLLWNPQQPVWPLVDEFLAAYYGAASPKVRLYLDTFHQHVREQRDCHPSLFDPPTTPLFDEAVVAPADAALAEGETLVRGEERRRVRLLRDGLTYARTYRACGTFRRDGDLYHGDATDADRLAFESAVRDWQRAGLQRLRERAPFETTAQLLRNRLAVHRVEWLRDGGQEIAVAPTLGGRLLEWQAFDHQWLAQPAPDDSWHLYPMGEGYMEFAMLDMYDHRGWSDAYRVRRPENGLALTVDLPECDLRLSRSYTFHNGLLHIESYLENRGAVERQVGWGAGLHLAVPAAAQVTAPMTEGQADYAWENLPDGLGNALILEGKQLPQGGLVIDSAGCRMTHRWSGQPITRTIVGKVDARNLLALDLRADAVVLPPDQRLTVTQMVEIERVAG